MPANVETAVYANSPAWHGEGTVLDTDGEKGMTIEVALPASGLDWEVEKVPCYADFGGEKILVPNRFAVVRTTDGKPFSTVGKTWEPTQNRQGFQIIDDVIAIASGEVGKTWIESAFSLDGGARVAILAHIENDWQIAGEKYDQYMLFVNGHDGRTSVTMATTNVRAVCANTVALALEGNERVIRVRHTKNAGDRIKAAVDMLKLRNQYNEQLAIQGEFLAETAISDAEFEKFVNNLIPTDQEDGTPGHTMVQQRRDAVTSIYMSAPNLADIRGTRWGALQAAIEYTDHGREFKDSNTAIKNQFGLVGSGTALKDRAFKLVKSKKLMLA